MGEKFRIMMSSDTKAMAPNFREVQQNVNDVFACMTAPTMSPSPGPTMKPTKDPTLKPTKRPTMKPTKKPTAKMLSDSESQESVESASRSSDSSDDAAWFPEFGQNNDFKFELNLH